MPELLLLLGCENPHYLIFISLTSLCCATFCNALQIERKWKRRCANRNPLLISTRRVPTQASTTSRRDEGRGCGCGRDISMYLFLAIVKIATTPRLSKSQRTNRQTQFWIELWLKQFTGYGVGKQWMGEGGTGSSSGSGPTEVADKQMLTWFRM